MNYRKTYKTVLSVLIVALLLLTGVFGIAFAETEYVKVYDYNGKVVRHYGTGKEVTIPKTYLTEEYEMRGVWVATVYNIAISKQTGVTEKAINAYKAEFLSILDRMEEYNMNTLYFQVRPSNDAFYNSEINPWSQFLAGAGVNPGWDPLEWMVEETHKRGFVFQCWMNAFRVTVYSVLPETEAVASKYTNEQLISYKNDALSDLADGNFAKENPDCVVMGESDTRLILNPSDPRVQQHLVDTAMEIVENYDVDGFHFDDYFYLSGGGAANTYNGNFAGGKTYDSTLTGDKCLNDLPNYEAYKNGDSAYAHLPKGLNLGDFRRASLNHMIKSIREAVDEYNEKNNDVVEFGAKPAAVWRSNIEYCTENLYRCDENGSNTHASAYSSYNDLYADTLTWAKEGWVDYMAPQVYYGFTSTEAPYADLVMWWADQIEQINIKNREEGKKEVKLYIAHGIYKYRDDKTQFALSSEIKNQLYYNQKFPSIQGSAFYSYENLYKFVDKTHEQGMNLVKRTWSEKTIPIPVGEFDAKGLIIENPTIGKIKGTETRTISFDLLENANVYAMYKVPKGETLNTSDVTQRILVEFEGYQENNKITLSVSEYDSNYDYYLKAFSKRYHMSDETYLINFENAEEYTPLSAEEIKMNEYYNQSTNVEINVKADYRGVKTLSYEIYIDSDGDSSFITKGQTVDGNISYTWKSWPFAVMDAKVKVIITDGEFTTTVYSNVFNIANIFNIIYDLKSDKASIDGPTTYVEGIGLSELPTPTLEGSTFLGWETESGAPIDSIGIYYTGDIKLVAKWQTNAPTEQPKKGCGKSASLIMVSTMSALSLMVLMIRKK